MKQLYARAAAVIMSLLAANSAPASELGGRSVISEVSADLNGDGIPDRAVLTGAPDGQDEVGLAVYLSADGRLPLQPSVDKPAIGWRGTMAGSEPKLSLNPRGSLVIVFENDAVGRHRWRRQMTIAYRDGALVVAGYTYTSRDTLDPKSGGNCDINLLSGKGTRNGKAVAVRTRSVSLAQWTDESVPEVCAFD